MRSTLCAAAAAFTVALVLAGCGATPVARTATSPTNAPADATAFWALVRSAFVDAGRVKVDQAGADSAWEFRYEPTASERITQGRPVVVCVDGLAYFLAQGVITPGQGTSSCGADAFVDCFRAFGGPADGAYSTALEANKNIAERIGVAADGTWTWNYSADKPYDGPVTATVWLDPTTGRIVRAVQQDPQGTATWTVEYGATFAPIVQPGT
jgi:hypothetical protein